MDLKCEFPEGCKLDLWAEVVKAKHIRETIILDDRICIFEEEIRGRITDIEDIRIKILDTDFIFNFDSVSICIVYKTVLLVLIHDEEQVVTIINTYKQTIKLCEFDPPLTLDEFRSEIDSAEIVLENWLPEWDIIGNCVNLSDASFFSPVPGTIIRIRIIVCLAVKLVKMHDIIVYGELDPVC